MVCNGFKGGIGTSSRKLSEEAGGYGRRARPVQLRPQDGPAHRRRASRARDRGLRHATTTRGLHHHRRRDGRALLPTPLTRLARRASLGLARDGSIAGNGSGDIFIAFSTANPGAAKPTGVIALTDLPNDRMNPLFSATVQAVEEAIVNAMVAAETMKGANDLVVRALHLA
jgi:L-aminopeptidase/D-esterase-like protein